MLEQDVWIATGHLNRLNRLFAFLNLQCYQRHYLLTNLRVELILIEKQIHQYCIYSPFGIPKGLQNIWPFSSVFGVPKLRGTPKMEVNGMIHQYQIHSGLGGLLLLIDKYSSWLISPFLELHFILFLESERFTKHFSLWFSSIVGETEPLSIYKESGHNPSFISMYISSYFGPNILNKLRFWTV